MLNFQGSPFQDVRFALIGFDPIKYDQVRSKLVSVGGVDVGEYGPNCTHVIVDKLVYDDLVCIAARSDGKALVSSLWVDHSLDVGVPVDTSPIMYQPVKDLDGIPGAKDFVMCLTGYQRHDRDDIMTLVNLMGAQFSKPLVANRVTHLICYKFEGEKYDLAKRMKKIKLVNHQWLEDCLKAWEILPEENYCKSGYELEMEAAAKNSEDEAPEFDARLIQGRLHNLQNKLQVNHNTPFMGSRLPTAEPAALSNFGNIKDVVAPIKSELKSDNRANNSNSVNQKDQLEATCVNDGASAPKSNNLLDAQFTVPSLNKVGSYLPDSSESAKKLLDDAKLSALCYSRKTPSSSIRYVSEGRSHPSSYSSPSIPNGGRNNVSSVPFEGPSNGIDVADEAGPNCSLVPKRKMNGDSEFSPRSKFQKLNSSARKVDAEETLLSISSSSKASKNALVNTRAHSMQDVSVTVGCAHKESTIPEKELFEYSFPISRSLASELVDGDEPVDGCCGSRSSIVPVTSITKGKEECQDQQQNQRPFMSSASDKVEAVKSLSPMLDATHVATSSFPRSARKSSAKKTLGSRPKLNRENLTENSSVEKAYFLSVPENGAADHANLADAFQADIIVSCDKANTAASWPKNDVLQSARKPNDNDPSLDDETEAPMEVGNLDNAGDCKVSELNVFARAESKGQLDDGNVTTAVVDENPHGARENQHKTGICNEKPGQGASICQKDNKGAKEKKPVSAEKMEPCPALARVLEPKTPVSGNETEVGKGSEKGGTGKRVLQSSGNTSHGMTSGKKLQSRVGKENENQPVVDDERNMEKDGQLMGSSSSKLRKTAKKNTQMSRDGNSPFQGGRTSDIVKNEPGWFILSGHRLQRKEFQRVIKKLKGRLCRDSHQWSYQATHFIVPDPVRRTEKFFAAVASGSWVLKIDYLSASDEAGKLLPEEPYEWHKNGISEDGAVNLEAPRKWRLMRERTGHGAFYGMRIIIYGDCIAPSLDTLKRVLKAGDGTVLATSPPYTRFINSEVDFAIISPGMPRADAWVQEFLRHEIPCVLADYLVEYVCKPGYSLDKHVLYNTQDWAARSFAKLVRRSEEVVESLGSPDNQVSRGKDLSCQVCGTSDKGEVMLICGDMSGSVGCGIGIHIDCCDPPLEKVPKEDWFCKKCSTAQRNRTRKTTSSKNK